MCDEVAPTQVQDSQEQQAKGGRRRKPILLPKLQKEVASIAATQQMLLASAQLADAPLALDVLILKSKECATPEFFKVMEEIAAGLIVTDQAAASDAKLGITAVFSYGLQYHIRCLTNKHRQRSLEKTKLEVQRRGLRARVVVGSPTMKRILEGPARSTYMACKKLVDGQPDVGTVWPKAADKVNWAVRSGTNQNPTYLVTGNLVDGTVQIQVRNECRIGGQQIPGSHLVKELEGSKQFWRNYPFEVCINIVADPDPPNTKKTQ